MTRKLPTPFGKEDGTDIVLVGLAESYPAVTEKDAMCAVIWSVEATKQGKYLDVVGSV